MMIEESAEVRLIEGDTVWLETQRKSACGSCQMRSGCGSGILAQFFANRTSMIQTKHTMSVCVGDTVIVGMPEKALSKGAFMTYMAPILGMLLGGVLAGNIAGFSNDGAVFIGGGGGFFMGFLMAQWSAKLMARKSEYQPVILRKRQKIDRSLSS